MTDWDKVLEVFGSGIIGVFIVMIALQIVTQLSTAIIDLIENWNTEKEEEESTEESNAQAVAAKE